MLEPQLQILELGPVEIAVIITPTLYLHGANDGCINPDLIGFAAKNLSAGSIWKLLEDTGHFPHLEAPVRFLSLLDNWFASGSSLTV
jgi:pimeloyl-ACP methyl ester carboxylesterase